MPRGVGTSKNGTKMPAHKKQSGGIRSFLVNLVQGEPVHHCVYVATTKFYGRRVVPSFVYILVPGCDALGRKKMEKKEEGVQ